MGLRKYVRQVRPIQNKVDHVKKFIVSYLSSTSFADSIQERWTQFQKKNPIKNLFADGRNQKVMNWKNGKKLTKVKDMV